MPVTILDITNNGSSVKKLVAFEHEEELGIFRKKIKDLAGAAINKRITEGTIDPLCFDDIWADIMNELPETRWQSLDLRTLVGLPSENVKVLAPKES